MKAIFVYLLQEGTDFLVESRWEHRLKRMPQLGFQYLAASLKEKGVDSEIFDQTLHVFTVDDLIDRVNASADIFVGFYTSTGMKSIVSHYVRQFREKKCNVKILVGGPGSVDAEHYLMAGCDVVCHGESERTINEIVDCFQEDRSMETISGISYLSNGVFQTTKPRELIDDLDSLPYPERGLVPLKHYYNHFIFNMRLPFVSMIASRGCPNKCSYCYSHVHWGNRYRKRSPQNVIGEIDHLVKEYGVRYINFKDDIFGLEIKWLREFCELLIGRKYDLTWWCILHPFSLKNDVEEMLDLMKEAGCVTITFGLQSADPQVLVNVNRKPGEPKALTKLMAAAKRKGFLTILEMIFGLPGETEESIHRSIRYIADIGPHYLECFALSRLEGSDLQIEFQNRKVCDLSEEEVRKWARVALRRHYTDPRTLVQIFGYIIRHNPLWLLKGLRFLPFLLEGTGFQLKRKAH